MRRSLVSRSSTGPLAGIKIIEFAGIGPGPFAAMMLADMGAEVIRVERTPPPGKASSSSSSSSSPPPSPSSVSWDVHLRGRKSIAINLKDPDAHKLLLSLIRKSDGLIEGFRPGVMERLNLGPKECLSVNNKLIYGRITGWGQTGPLSQAAGHDLNFISLSAALNSFQRQGNSTSSSDNNNNNATPPMPPLNLLGDYGGGGMMLSFGMVCGLLQAKLHGKGDVIDSSMVEGSATLMSFFWGLRGIPLPNTSTCTPSKSIPTSIPTSIPSSDGKKATRSDNTTDISNSSNNNNNHKNNNHSINNKNTREEDNPAGVPSKLLKYNDEQPGTHFLATGAHFYNIYQTSDDRYISIASIEPQFYDKLLEILNLTTDSDMRPQHDPSKWPAAKQKLQQVIQSKPLQHWINLLEGTDVCFAPVLTMQEALNHPHNISRQSFISINDIPQPAPHPRFTFSVPKVPTPPPYRVSIQGRYCRVGVVMI